MNKISRNIVLWVIMALLIGVLFNVFQETGRNTGEEEISFSDFMNRVESGDIVDVTIKGPNITGHSRDRTGAFATYAPNDPRLIDNLRAGDVHITAAPPDSNRNIFAFLIGWLPFFVIIGVWIFFMRQMQGGGRGAMGFGKSKAKLLNQTAERKTFEDVAGIDEAKQELEEVVEFLRDPQKFQRLGGKIPKGVLLVGPPGTGKTLLARAIAGEANVPFFSISGSDFVEMFVGVGASRVRDMFEQGKKNAPCIIFLDEIDAVGRSRGSGFGGGGSNDEREQTLNQLLVEMDGFETNEGIIMIAATNRPDVLDPALLRPGRFDRQVDVPNPDILGREKILKVHMRPVPLAPDVDARVIARGTPGFSGADLANLINEAALMAARANKRLVTMSDFENAKDKVMMGPERRSMVMSEDEKKATAYHEAGHALVNIHVDGTNPLHKVTIIPRGRALGVTWSLPEQDEISQSQKQLEAGIAMAFGGRVAEELVFGEENISTGAHNDIIQATTTARAMVTEYGFSKKLGPLNFRKNQQDAVMNGGVQVSGATAKIIDEEIRRIVEEGETKAREVLSAHLDELHLLAQGLLEYELLSGDEVDLIIAGKPIERPDPDDETPSAQGPRSSVPPSGAAPSKSPQQPSGLDPEPQGS